MTGIERTAIDGRDEANDDGPNNGDEVSKECVINRRIAADTLQDVKAVSLDDVFCNLMS